MRFPAFVFSFVFGLAVQTHAQSFDYSVEGTKVPWTHERFDAAPDKFMFAIHSDLTGGERPDIFATAMAQLALLRPEFLISIGDLIEGGGTRKELIAEWESYDTRVRSLDAPVFYAGGNHDLSSTLERQVWAERYGPFYYHFRYKDVLFLVLDSEDVAPERRDAIATARAEAVEIFKSEGPAAFAATPYGQSPERESGAISEAQADYFAKVIAANPDVRHSFVFVHKPVWLRKGGTPFQRIEQALAGHAYTVFNGHVQAYSHRVRHAQDYIQLATTGGKQFPELGFSEDHITLVTVSGKDVVIANLMLAGIRDKTGAIPNNGGALCFSTAACESQ